MKQSRTAIFALMAIFSMVALSTVGCELTTKPPRYSDTHETIFTDVGMEFQIALESNPTTGYQWQLAHELDDELLELVAQDFEKPEEDLMGAPGTELWTFKGKGVGQTTISFKYARPWEKEAEPLEVKDFSVVIRKKGTEAKKPAKHSEPDKEIQVELGHEFIITLEAEVSEGEMGYRWQLSEEPVSAVLRLENVTMELKGSEGSKKAVESWTFKGVGQGEATLKFVYLPTWEKDATPKEEKEFHVKVEISSAEESSPSH